MKDPVVLPCFARHAYATRVQKACMYLLSLQLCYGWLAGQFLPHDSLIFMDHVSGAFEWLCSGHRESNGKTTRGAILMTWSWLCWKVLLYRVWIMKIRLRYTLESKVCAPALPLPLSLSTSFCACSILCSFNGMHGPLYFSWLVMRSDPV